MSQENDKKELNFELNLLPVISMMSVCICFLLLTAVWTQIGSLNVDQGLGQDSSSGVASGVKNASLWITMRAGGVVNLKMMDADASQVQGTDQNFTVGADGSGWSAVESETAELKRALPSLKTALIMADSSVNYGDVVHMMDRLKILKIAEIGIAPL